MIRRALLMTDVNDTWLLLDFEAPAVNLDGDYLTLVFAKCQGVT